jgi:hypothetical protein
MERLQLPPVFILEDPAFASPQRVNSHRLVKLRRMRFPCLADSFDDVRCVAEFRYEERTQVLVLFRSNSRIKNFMRNKAVLKPSEQLSVVMEQFLRLLHYCGMDPSDVDLLNCKGPVAQQVFTETPVRLTQFTGSSKVGEMLSNATNGKIRLEDAGLDWMLTTSPGSVTRMHMRQLDKSARRNPFVCVRELERTWS